MSGRFIEDAVIYKLSTDLEHFMNQSSKEDREELINCLVFKVHRTIQQKFTRFIVQLLERYALLGSGQYDQRNEATVLFAREVMNKCPGAYKLPTV